MRASYSAPPTRHFGDCKNKLFKRICNHFSHGLLVVISSPCCRPALAVEQLFLLAAFVKHRKSPFVFLLESESSCRVQLEANLVELQLLLQHVERDRKLLRLSRHSTMHHDSSTRVLLNWDPSFA